MVALPTSLRRTMIMLLVVMSTVVMVFYWNQTSIKPLSFTTTTFEKSSKSKLVQIVSASNAMYAFIIVFFICYCFIYNYLYT